MSIRNAFCAVVLMMMVSFSEALAESTAVIAAPRGDAWMEKHKKLREWPDKEKIRVLFFGDSITEAWRSEGPQGGLTVWKERFEPLGSANFGISGDRTQQALWRIENGELDGAAPRVVVLMIGTNNTGLERGTDVPRNSVPEIIAGIGKVISAMKSKLPESKILLLGIFPRGEQPSDPQRLQVEEINRELPKFADGNRVTFLNIGSHFVSSDGRISADVMSDFLHPGPKGYQIWADAIAQPLQKILTLDR